MIDIEYEKLYWNSVKELTTALCLTAIALEVFGGLIWLIGLTID